MGQARACPRGTRQLTWLFARFFGAFDQRVDAIGLQPVASREKTDGFSLRNAGRSGHFTKFCDHILVPRDTALGGRHSNYDSEFSDRFSKMLSQK